MGTHPPPLREDASQGGHGTQRSSSKHTIAQTPEWDGSNPLGESSFDATLPIK